MKCHWDTFHCKQLQQKHFPALLFSSFVEHILVSLHFCFNVVWYEQRHISCWLTQMKLSLIPAVLSLLLAAKRQECDPLHSSSATCAPKSLICQKTHKHGITWCNPTITPKCSLFSTWTKGQYVSFQPSESCHPHLIFQELKFSYKNLHAFVNHIQISPAPN